MKYLVTRETSNKLDGFFKQHFYKQRQTEIGKKSSKSNRTYSK